MAQSGIADVIASGLSGMIAGMDQALRATSGAPGIPYLTEMTTAIEGTGPMVDMLRQMGMPTMRMEVTSVSTDAIPDRMFEIPEGYTVVR